MTATPHDRNPRLDRRGIVYSQLENPLAAPTVAVMNKPEQNQNADSGDGCQAEPRLTAKALTKTMGHPSFTAEQLPKLWQQITNADGRLPREGSRWRSWGDGIEALYSRCETYPQYAAIAGVLSWMPDSAWCETVAVLNQARELLEQATPEQLQQALAHNQEDPGTWWLIYDDVLRYATVEQLTGAVIEQLPWDNRMADWAIIQEAKTTEHDRRRRHIVDQIQQRLLGGNKNAWTVFLGIVETGNRIGETSELAAAVANQTTNRPATTT